MRPTWGAAILILCAIVALGYAARSAWTESRLRAGTTAEAEITRLFARSGGGVTGNDGRTRDMSPDHFAAYTWQAPEGPRTVEEELVTDAFHAAHSVGDVVPLLVAPDGTTTRIDPEIGGARYRWQMTGIAVVLLLAAAFTHWVQSADRPRATPPTG